MKTLVVYNKEGQLIFTQTNATDSYNLIVEDVTDDKEVVGVDIKTGKAVTIREDTSLTKKNKALEELQKKNELYNLNQQLEQVSSENEELRNELQQKIKRLEMANAEFGELLFTEDGE